MSLNGVRSETMAVKEPSRRVMTRLGMRHDRLAAPDAHRGRPWWCQRRLTPNEGPQLLSGVRPRDQVGKARKQLALDHANDVERLDVEPLKVRTAISKVPLTPARCPWL